jgi:site-specific DNA-methyltransferase (adenine-specific)
MSIDFSGVGWGDRCDMTQARAPWLPAVVTLIRAGMGTLYYGDNLEILRNEIASESVDLIYLDPPFNSNANYNVLFRAPDGHESHAQMEAFDDTWHWTEAAEKAFDEVMQSGNADAAEMLRAMRSFLKENDMMAYLTMMAVRLLELHRVLRPTGSIYLHCDPTASHYLKILLDAVFGKERFGSEIIWKRYGAHSNSNRYGAVHDVLLYYTVGQKFTFNKQYAGYEEEYVKERFKFSDPDGRRWAEQNLGNPAVRPNLMYSFKAKNGVLYNPPTNGWKYSRERMLQLDAENRLHYPQKEGGRLRLKSYQDELPGVQLQDVWTDLVSIGGTSGERLGYPTQKPLALLERIISASSNEGDVVLDPFCGCGTTVHAAQKLNRNWIGIDVTHLAISLIQKRLRDAFPLVQIEVHGTPKDLEGARALAAQDKYQFQWWAVSLVDAVPFGNKKKGADGGIDGLIYFKPDGKATEKAIVSVKGGENVGVQMVRELNAVVDREKAKMGVLITLADATMPMRKEAVTSGYYRTEAQGDFAKIQIVTIEELLNGKKPQTPWVSPDVFKKAKREMKGEQGRLL